MGRIIISDSRGLLQANAPGVPAFVVGALPLMCSLWDYSFSGATLMGSFGGITPSETAVELRSSKGFITQLDALCVTHAMARVIYGNSQGVSGIKTSDRSKLLPESGGSLYSRRPRAQSDLCLFGLAPNSVGITSGYFIFCCSHDIYMQLDPDNQHLNTVDWADAVDVPFQVPFSQIAFRNAFADVKSELTVIPAGTILAFRLSSSGLSIPFMVDMVPTTAFTYNRVTTMQVYTQGLEIAHRGITNATPYHTWLVARSKLNFYYNDQITGMNGLINPAKILGFGQWYNTNQISY
jgi:hypothetical protein